MGRYAKANQTIADLQKMIEDNGGVKEIIYNDKLKVHKDLLKVDMGHDFAGLAKWPSAQGIPDYEMLGSGNGQFPVAWCYSHAEGEWAVAFVLYIGQEGELRAYIPLHGNNVNGHETISWTNFVTSASPSSNLDYGKMKNAVLDRISVKGEAGSGKGGEAPLTFRQIIQSLKDYRDQYASVMPHAKGAENPFWGIQDIWFENGVLNLGQIDDEGDSCDLIAKKIEECVPSDLLDGVAVVRVGVTENVNGKMELYDADGEVSANHTVKSSEVKPTRDDDWFCKWILKYAS